MIDKLIVRHKLRWMWWLITLIILSTTFFQFPYTTSIGSPALAKSHKKIVTPNIAQIDPIAQPVHPVRPKIKLTWHSTAVRQRDTLWRIAQRLEINRPDYQALVNNPETKQITQLLRPKRTFKIAVDERNRVHRIVYVLNEDQVVVIDRVKNKFELNDSSKPLFTIKSKFLGKRILIRGSLAASLKRSGIEPALRKKTIDVLHTKVSFPRKIRAGDKLKIIYQKLYRNNEFIGNGNIMAIELVSKKRKYIAIYHKSANGKDGYYMPSGASLKSNFLRFPIKYKRISSPFHFRRKHPIFKTVRFHKGIDLAARVGTPVKSVGDGRVKFFGRKGGYGRLVVIKHGRRYTTYYAHLSRYANNLSRGKRIKRGQVIGYVGTSGFSTGPHLHYEFRDHNRPRNPATVRLPLAQPISLAEKAAFKYNVKLMLSKLRTVA